MCRVIALSMAELNNTHLKMGHQIFEVLNNIFNKWCRSFLALEFLDNSLEIKFYNNVVDVEVETKLEAPEYR